jgi:hypothetical protein
LKKKLIGVLVVVVAALALGTTLASAAISTYTISLSIQPGHGGPGAAITFSGVYADNGVGVSGSNVEWERWQNGTCSGAPEGSGFLTTTGANGHYTVTATNGLPAGPWSFKTFAGSEETAISPCRQ